ncbi:MAG: CAP domain-containing protein [Cyanobacteria bacterium P01_A01_bin.135]
MVSVRGFIEATVGVSLSAAIVGLSLKSGTVAFAAHPPVLLQRAGQVSVSNGIFRRLSRLLEKPAAAEPPFKDAAAEQDPFARPLTPTTLSNLAASVVAETNLVRANPAGYAAKLEALRPHYQGTLVQIPGQPSVRTTEGISALDEAIADLKSRRPMSTLESSPGLSWAAADHARDLGSRGGFGHFGKDGSLPLDRVGRYGTIPPGSLIGENISFGPPASAKWHVIQLLVDDNFPSRAHRETLLNPEYRLTGSSCAPHHTQFRIVCAATYASDYRELRSN